jgi:hypothetical protein
MTMQISAEELERQHAQDEAQRAQERLHEADPRVRIPMFLPADAEGFETEAYTAGWQDEPGA